MLPADWSISTSHDPFALQFLWWKMLWNLSIQCSLRVRTQMVQRANGTGRRQHLCRQQVQWHQSRASEARRENARVADGLRKRVICLQELGVHRLAITCKWTAQHWVLECTEWREGYKLFNSGFMFCNCQTLKLPARLLCVVKHVALVNKHCLLFQIVLCHLESSVLLVKESHPKG